MSIGRTLSCFVVILASTLSTAIPASAAVTSEQAVAFVNQQRAANGLPSVAADPNLALGCRQHNRYMQAAGDYSHGEDPSSPYSTPKGQGQGPYGGSEVLATGDGYSPEGRGPWEWAPIHLYLMLHPDRTRVGYDASSGYACMRAAGSRTEEAGSLEPRFFSYPGPQSSGIYPDEYAAEWPYTPQQLVGIPEGGVTGTNILLFSLGTRGLRAASFALNGPAGAVAARMVDEGTSNEVGSGSWFAGGGVIVPEQPLAEHTTYTVSVRWRNLAYGEAREGEPAGSLAKTEFFSQEFSFTTGAMSRESRERRPWEEPVLRLRRVGRAGKFVRLRLVADRALVGQSARFAVFRHERGCGPAFASAAGPCGWRQIGGRRMRTLRLRASQILEVREPDRWQKATIKVRTPRFEVGDVRFASALAKFTIRR